MPPATINVGILGLGPVWERRYVPALQNLRQRIRVRAIYDAVVSRAELAAEEFDADVSTGLLALLDRSDVRAVLLLDSSWQGWTPLRFVCSRKKPAYLAGSLGEDLAGLHRLHEAVCTESLMLMPEFSRRYTPATGRLQELLATCLGRPQHIEIEATLPGPDEEIVPGQGPGCDFLIGLLDWCRHIVRTRPARVESGPLDAHRPGRRVDVEFAPSRSGGTAPVAELRLFDSPPGGASDSRPTSPRFRVECEHGRALIESPAAITWSTQGEPTTESLLSERSEVEVMLDHFCRRVAGGLIPIPEIGDVCRSMALALAAEESLRDRRPISIDGQFP